MPYSIRMMGIDQSQRKLNHTIRNTNPPGEWNATHIYSIRASHNTVDHKGIYCYMLGRSDRYMLLYYSIHGHVLLISSTKYTVI